jgi:hypothetical protein
MHDFDIVKETSTHYIAHCPNCSDGKKEPKLYLSKDNGKFICFRCNYSGQDPDTALNSVFENRPDPEMITKSYSLDLIPNLDSEGALYLLKRGLTREVIELYGFKSYFIWGKSCIFIPNRIENNITDFFQLRFIDNGEFRYYTATSTKPLFGIQGLTGTDTLMLAEGIFTAIGAKMKLGHDCISLLGKTLTAYQRMQLMSLAEPYKELVVALDAQTYPQSYSLARTLLEMFPEKKISLILLADDADDYADMDRDIAIKYFNNRIKLSNSSDLGFIKVINQFKSKAA